MPRKIIRSFEDLPRPELVTPEKGSKGDLCDQSQKEACNLVNVMQRYAGNLAEIRAWQVNPGNYGTQPPDNLEDALQMVEEGVSTAQGLGYDSISEAIDGLSNPEDKGLETASLDDPATPPASKEENNNEA